jgi:hypothetical protein
MATKAEVKEDLVLELIRLLRNELLIQKRPSVPVPVPVVPAVFLRVSVPVHVCVNPGLQPMAMCTAIKSKKF